MVFDASHVQQIEVKNPEKRGRRPNEYKLNEPQGNLLNIPLKLPKKQKTTLFFHPERSKLETSFLTQQERVTLS